MKKILFPLLLATSLLATACGGPLKYQVPSSSKAPGADAHITAEVREEQHATQLEIEVENLAPPDRVSSTAQHYVAWQRKSSSQVWSRISALAYDADKRKGTLTASVPETSFDLSITAEQELNVASPSSDIIFSQKINK